MTYGDFHDRAQVLSVIDTNQIIDMKRAEQQDHKTADQVTDCFLGRKTENDGNDASACQQRIEDRLGRHEQGQDRIAGAMAKITIFFALRSTI